MVETPSESKDNAEVAALPTLTMSLPALVVMSPANDVYVTTWSLPEPEVTDKSLSVRVA